MLARNSAPEREDAVVKKLSYLLALVLLCGVGHAGEPIPEGARFIGHLRQATVELVAVTHYRPTVKSQWWRPDGTLAEPSPYLRQESKTRGVHINWGTSEVRFLPDIKSDNAFHIRRGRKGVTFLIRLSNPSTGQSSYGDDRHQLSTADTSRPAYDLPIDRPNDDRSGYQRSADDALQPVFAFRPWGPSPEVDHVAGVGTGRASQRKGIFSPEWASDTVVDADGKLVRDYIMFTAVVAEPAQTAVLRVGLSMEAWETVASQQPDRADSSSFNRDGQPWTVEFGKADTRGPGGGTQIRLKTTLSGYESYNKVTQRLVAVTNDGNEHTTKWGNGYWEYGRTIVYDLPLSSIKEFRFQVSPYDWVEFRNVSLRPRPKTDVQVLSVETPVEGFLNPGRSER
jgi:hypothetical protein